jgi:two-component sensor histidine kinase
MVHELLYKHDDYVQIDFALYVNKLAQHLVYACANVPVKMNLHSNKIKLSLETMTHLGLVLQELLSNSLKYAFSDKGEINIELRKEDEKYVLNYSDSGTSNLKEVSSTGLGLELIELKVQQMSGTVSLTHDNGFKYHIEFYDEKV